MDLVDIDKVLDDLELDENEVLSKSQQIVDENKAVTFDENSKKNVDESKMKNDSIIQLPSEDLSYSKFQKSKLNTIVPTNQLINKQDNIPSSTQGKFSLSSNNAAEVKNFNSFETSNSNVRSNKTNGSCNRIVAVSQVFNSLDEYRRDVESLRVGINQINSAENDLNEYLSSNCNITNGDKNSDDNNVICQTQKLNLPDDVDLSNARKKLLSDIEIKTNSNIKFHNDDLLTKIMDDDDSCDGLTSTSSITTSSPSSFSSGPSPRSPSSTDCVPDDDINELGEYERDELSIPSKNINERTESNLQTTYQISENTIGLNKTEKKSINISKIGDDENLEDSNGQNSIDLVGLSSISNSSLYIENSLSSIQPEEVSIEHNKNIEYTKLSKFKISNETQNGQQNSPGENKLKVDEISTDEDISTPTTSELIKNSDINNKNKVSICDNNIDTSNNYKNEQNYLIENKSEDSNQHSINKYEKTEFRKHKPTQKADQLPITFGSTMDEISDTELDSMLQDIDNEIQNNSVLKDKQLLIDDNIESQNIKEIGNASISKGLSESGGEQDKTNETLQSLEKVKISQTNSRLTKDEISSRLVQDYESIEEIKMNIKTVDDDNFLNADSFSQASTIEFADSQSQNDLRVIENDSGLIFNNTENRNENKLNKFNSSLVIDNNKGEHDFSEIIVGETKKLESKDSSVLTEIYTDRKQIENTTREQSQPKRPNVLNLSITNSKILSTSASVSMPEDSTIDNLNLDGTAGQTPPASAITSLSTSLVSRSQDSSPVISSSSNQQIEGNGSNLCNSIETGKINDVIDDEDTDNITKSVLKPSRSQNYQLGKVPPFWIPDSEASFCMQCKVKFSIIKRRHHCRACGHVLCSLCCSQKAKLEFLGNDNEVRVCVQCHLIINNSMRNNVDNDDLLNESISELGAVGGVLSNSHINTTNINNITSIQNNSNNILTRSPNPNNPMEYCSTIPPLEQVKKNVSNNKPISVMVPVGVLKREGALSKSRKDKNVIFSDGIRPGCDLADLDNNWLDKSGISNSSQYSSSRKNSDKEYLPPANPRILRKMLPICDENNSYIPKAINALPPIYEKLVKTNEYDYKEVINNSLLIDRLQKECLKFAVQRNFYVYVKIVKLTCCVNKTVINFTTNGMHHVGQDEIIILLEYDNSNLIPKDIFIHLNEIYRDADKGHPISELGYSIAKQQHFLSSIGSKTTTNGGFLYIRSTFQCLQEIRLPSPPFLIGVLIHRWEIPWAKIFPLRLMLRLGAQFRYYPSPHLSIRARKSVYAEIAQTIINFLADFRNYSYTIPIIKGMFIHMEDRKTSVLIPKNRHDQIVKAMNNSSDHILALGGNFSKNADGHLVCIQNLESDCPDTHTYSTQAINIQGQPRRVTGASFLVLNGALKTNSGLSGKCSIVEDGLMVHILSQKMQSIRKNLKNMNDVDIRCGPIDADESQTEMVSIQWIDDDTEFNIGVKSPIDDKNLDGISSIRVHSGLNYSNSNFVVRWTEVFLIQSKEKTIHGKTTIDISKISEQIARSASTALVPLLDLLAASGCLKIGLRVTLHQDNVCYESGSKNFKLAPLYMNALDNELIPILHKQATLYEINNPIILELIFHILHK